MAVGDKVVVMVAVVLSGVVSGLLNTLFTGTAMSISPAPRPVASAGYNFCRWLGGAAAATLVGPAADLLRGVQTPFAVAAVACVLAAVLLAVVRHGEDDPRQLPAEAPLVGEQL
jgi:MFS family permease